ncbi:MAG: hypothetical protein IK016_01690 [Lachnospiraceae bacterium]|nr:hypothetical protein [Lachnospiraceae bacterium]
MTEKEKELYGPLLHNPGISRRIFAAVDLLRGKSMSGVIVTATDEEKALNVAKGLIRSATRDDKSFSGRVAKAKGESLTPQGLPGVFEKIKNGAMIVTQASRLEPETAKVLAEQAKAHEKDAMLLLLDTDKRMRVLLHDNPELAEVFSHQVDIENADEDSLVAFGREYAREREYSIDDLGLLALHTRIQSLSTYEYEVTTDDVRKIIDEAIENSEKHGLGHFMDVLRRKRYDDEDMIILREKDFLE